uniref:Uncharacterized protein n=1 Tax=Anopheles minimus TaxID=112268 RepID=A0A182VPQ6_9DIPT
MNALRKDCMNHVKKEAGEKLGKPERQNHQLWMEHMKCSFLNRTVRSSSASDSICERIDFNDINTWKVQQCSGSPREIFRLRAYASSPLFQPFRESVTYFLSNDVRGISCTESINSFYMNAFTEIRMIYQLMFRNPCLLTLMVYDLDTMDQYGEPLLAQNWTTRAQTSTWSLFVGKVEREIRRARIQLQADMSADGELAIDNFHYYTHNYHHYYDSYYYPAPFHYHHNFDFTYCYNDAYFYYNSFHDYHYSYNDNLSAIHHDFV